MSAIRQVQFQNQPEQDSLFCCCFRREFEQKEPSKNDSKPNGIPYYENVMTLTHASFANDSEYQTPSNRSPSSGSKATPGSDKEAATAQRYWSTYATTTTTQTQKDAF